MATDQQAVAVVLSIWESYTAIKVFLFPNRNCLVSLSCALNPRFASLCCPVLAGQVQKQHSTKWSWSRYVLCRSICWYPSSSSRSSYAESQWRSTVSPNAAWLISCQYLPINTGRRILDRLVMLTTASSMLPDSSLKMNEPMRNHWIIGCNRKNNGSLTQVSHNPLWKALITYRA